MIDYQHNLLSLSSALCKRYHLPYRHTPLDLSLEKYKKIVVILMDGMGMINMKENSYLKNHIVDTLSTVFPPTTVAATTALRTDKAPIESGYVGWKQYFKEYDASYVMFLNYDYYTRVKSEKTIDEIMDYHSWYDHLDIPHFEIFPAFRTKGMKKFEHQIDYCNQLLNKHEECFIYIYQDEYDALMHRYGIVSAKASQYYDYIDAQIQRLVVDQDTIVIMVADHGHIDVENIDISLYPEIMECLKRYPTIEDRAVSFDVKEEYLSEFKERFLQLFGKDFLLLSHQEVFDQHLLGYGKEHPQIHDFIGDYFALATSNKTISMHHIYPNVGQHAGYTKEELEIPLILLKKQSKEDC